ncbi:hypothetical protein MRX96_006867 [Rhipicephalus microplus]
MDGMTVPSTSSTHYLDFMTNRLAIAHQNSPPYWPESNGLIERMVGTLKQSQRKTTVRYGEKRRTSILTSGDLVLIELSARGASYPRYEGPLKITALVGGNKPKVQRVPHAPGKINEKILNVEQLRRHKEPLLEVTEPSPSNDTCA